ncbi:MAG: hypothetical protein ACREQ9_21900, partial [Candidatus Binatia bacterium]
MKLGSLSGRLLPFALMAVSWAVAADAQIPAGAKFRVNSFTTSPQDQASVGSDANGNFVVVWSSSGDQDGSGTAVIGQRFSA